MSKEFQYKQPKTTDNYRKGWEKVFSSKEDEMIICGNCGYTKPDHYSCTACGSNEIKQKHPYSNN